MSKEERIAELLQSCVSYHNQAVLEKKIDPENVESLALELLSRLRTTARNLRLDLNL